MAKKKMTLEEKLDEAIAKDAPYEVPENWAWIKYEYLTKETKLGLVRGSKEQSIDKKYKYLKMNNITKGGELDLNSVINVDASETEVDNYSLQVDDFLFNTRNSRELVGKNAVVKQCFNEHILFNNNIMRVRFNATANPTVISYYLNSPLGNLKLDEIKKVTTNVAAIYAKDLNNMYIPIPPIKEQQRIVDKIESLFEKLDKAKELIEEARDDFEKRRSAILEKAFRGELTKEWRKDNKLKYEFVDVLLGDIIEDGPKNGLYKPQSDYGGGNMIVRIDNFYNGKINPWNTLKKLKLTEDDISKYSLENGDIIINRVNSIEYLGKSALVRELNETCVFESNIMKVKLNKNVNNEYVVYYLNSIRGLYELRKTAKHAVNQASINQQDVKRAIVPLPSVEEQNEIVRILDKLLEEESKIEELTVLEEQIELIKKSILAKAFRGQLGTSCEEDESALELLKAILDKE